MSGAYQTPAQKEATTIRTLSRVSGISVSQIRRGLREFQKDIRQQQVARAVAPTPPPPFPNTSPLTSTQAFLPIPFRLDEKVLERGRDEEKTGPSIPIPPASGKYGLISTDGVLSWLEIAPCPDDE